MAAKVTSTAVPFLIPYLRASLKKLYSLPLEPDTTHSDVFATEKEAHAFLLMFQSRNIRRKFRSQEQRRRDQMNKNINQIQDNMENGENNELLSQLGHGQYDENDNQVWRQGSTWLACIYLLCQSQEVVHTSEKMFAAQTLIHRLRRMELKDAVDIEVESQQLLFLSLPQPQQQQQNFNINSSVNSKTFFDAFISFVTEWMKHSHIILHQIVIQMNLQLSQNQQLCQSEDYLKGQLIAAILPGITVLSALTLGNNDSYRNPIISTLGAAHSTAIIRFKYSTEHIHKSPPYRVPIPLITLLRDSIQLAERLIHVHIQAQNQTNFSEQYFSYIIAKITCMTLSTLPETIFSSAMSITRGRFSIDPRCTQCSAQELRSMTSTSESNTNRDDGLSLYQRTMEECLNHVISNNNNQPSQDSQNFILDIHTSIFMASERWVFYLPISRTFLLWIHPLLSAHLQPNHHNNRIETNDNIWRQKHVYQFLTSLFEASTHTPEQIIASNLGLVDLSNNSPNNISSKSDSSKSNYSRAVKPSTKTNSIDLKSSSSKAKQRRKEKLNRTVAASPNLMKQAMQERFDRKEMACFAALLLFNDLQYNLNTGMEHLSNIRTDNNDIFQDEDVDGEGIIGCASSCCKACLPHIMSIFQKVSASSKKNNTNMFLVIDDNMGQSNTLMATFDKILYNEDEILQRIGLFQKLMSFCFQICGFETNRNVRMFSYEILMALHAAILEIDMDDFNNSYSENIRKFYDVIVDSIFQCVMALAKSCAYPPNYFHNISLDSDEMIENERNDIRDLIRCVATITDDGGNVVDLTQHSSIKMIDRLVQECLIGTTNGINLATKVISPETVVHALSALAKPLTKLILRVNMYGEIAIRIVSQAMEALGNICQQLLHIFNCQTFLLDTDLGIVLPVSRLASLATASFARTFAAALEVTTSDNISNVESSSISKLRSVLAQTLDASMQAATLSLKHIPELMAISTLGDTMYDIRGAMRGPGGEDHVGCLALKRVIHENEKLAKLVLSSYQVFISIGKGRSTNEIDAAFAMISHLCHVLIDLKKMEMSRGRNIFHGEGVTPKSRRIVLNVVSRLGVLALKEYTSNSNTPVIITKFHQSISATMQDLFYSPVIEIVKLQSNAELKDEIETTYLACECAFDLASFASEMAGTLFDADVHSREPAVLQGVQMLINLLISGYDKLFMRPMVTTSSGQCVDELCIQWGRFRCALFTLFRSCASPSLPILAREALMAIIRIECDTAAKQCSLGAKATSSIFNDEVIGEDVLSAGAFITIISEVLDKIYAASKREGLTVENESELIERSQDTILSLHECRGFVFKAIMATDSEPMNGSYTDPRPTIMEAWYLSMCSMISLGQNNSRFMLRVDIVQELLSDSFSAAVLLLLLKPIGKADEYGTNLDPTIQDGMMMDGPHILALIQFLEAALLLGGLDAVGTKITSKLKFTMEEKAAFKSSRMMCIDKISFEEIGGAVFGASLLRAASGALPPWAVEGVPKLFSALFVAIGKRVDTFTFIIGCALELRLSEEHNHKFGALKPGEKLGGKYVTNLGEKAKKAFLAKVEEAGRADNAQGWRKLKVALKAACGGKKKVSGFNLKPSLTSWECDRV